VNAFGTFPRGFSSYQANVANAQLLERLARETNVPLERLQTATPADELTLRGIPAVGRGIAGVIRGTQPENEATG
jgi:hypothetical protein